MFERRLKVFLAVLLLVTMTLVLRAAKLQVLEHDAWVEHAAKLTTRSEHLEPQRGTIRDYRGVVLAMDETCVDACVDYRALVPEPDKTWITDVARARLTDRLGALYTDATLDRRRVLLAKEVEQVKADLRDLLTRLARVCGRKEQELEANGLLATCLQHEIDHLNGRLFIDHLSKLKRDRIIKKFTKAAKRAEE